MHLKKLELSGFKSFAKKAELQFTSPVTAIVGPNGSGKSNVAESFRFVLGEQSMKSMRGRRTEDLIWNGSPKIGRAGRARAALTFDNTPKASHGQAQRLLDIDFDEVTIERIIHRDASSEYLLNGSTVRLKDIVELLSGANIGASGHHIISQGETDRILNVGVRQRKEMVEDALGLKIYQYKKEESIRKLTKTQENNKEVNMLRREIKPHITFLEGQVKKIERAQEMRAELTERYREYFSREQTYLEAEAKRIAQKRAPHTQEEKRLAQALTEAKKTLSSLDAKDARSQKVLRLGQELSDMRVRKDELTRAVGRVEGALAAEERAHTQKGHKQSSAPVVPRGDVDAFVTRVQEVLDDVTEQADANILGRTLTRVRELLAVFVKEIRANTDDGDSGNAELKRLQKEKQTLRGELEQVIQKEAQLQEMYATLQKEIETDKDSGREAERLIFELSTKQSEVRLALQALDSQEERLTLEQEEYEREYAEAVALVGITAHQKPEEKLVEDKNRAAQEKRKKQIERLKIRLEDAGGASGEEVLKEYEEVKARDAHLERELADLSASSQSLQKIIAELDEALAKEFKEGIIRINTEFNTLFGLMFGGGSAKLSIVKEAVRSRDALAQEIFGEEESSTEMGLEISVTLPRKKIRSLEMLSGGERALTSIALLFAMSQVHPPPFLVLDETDAALDEANSKRYGDMIERLARQSQLIVVTHNRETMSRAGVLYGVTMGGDGTSQLLSVDFQEAAQVAK